MRPPRLGKNFVKLSDRLSSLNENLVMWLERVIALALLLGVIAFFITTLRMAPRLDWQSLATFHEMGQRVLLMTIGLELVRTLISHDLISIIGLLSFVIARRMLEPETVFWEIPLGVAAFAGLMATRRFLMKTVPGEPETGE